MTLELKCVVEANLIRVSYHFISHSFHFKWSLRKLNQDNAEAHTVAVLTLVLPPTLVTMVAATVLAIGREDQ